MRSGRLTVLAVCAVAVLISGVAWAVYARGPEWVGWIAGIVGVTGSTSVGIIRLASKHGRTGRRIKAATLDALGNPAEQEWTAIAREDPPPASRQFRVTLDHETHHVQVNWTWWLAADKTQSSGFEIYVDGRRTLQALNEIGGFTFPVTDGTVTRAVSLRLLAAIPRPQEFGMARPIGPVALSVSGRLLYSD